MRLDDSENAKNRLEQWHPQFCKEKQLLNNSSPNTIRYYKFCFVAYKKAVGS